MDYSAIDTGALLGGVGLFLLGMTLMTEGLKASAGPALTHILEKGTNTRLKGFISGFLATIILQSSHATLFLTIGFVNAGILSFAHSLWVIFGANVGTTTTGWLVALIGLKLKVELFSLPVIGLGAVMKLIWGEKKLGSFGTILAGFGILFLGIGFLQSSLLHAGSLIDFGAISGKGIPSIAGFFLGGLVLTLIMQSSSASTATILTLASTTTMPLTEAAAAIIGANIGSSLTAAIAAIGATASAKRAASAHVLFSVIASIFVFGIFPWFVNGVHAFSNTISLHIGVLPSIATDLALFHTSFNTLGVFLMIPFAPYLARFLLTLFKKGETSILVPKYLDKTLMNVPQLATEALYKELERYGNFINTSAIHHLSVIEGTKASFRGDQAVKELNSVIADYINNLHRESMPKDTSLELQKCVIILHYYEMCYVHIKDLSQDNSHYTILPEMLQKKLYEFYDLSKQIFVQTDPENPEFSRITKAEQTVFDATYRYIKVSLLESVTRGSIGVYDMEVVMRDIHLVRSAIKSIDKVSSTIDKMSRS